MKLVFLHGFGGFPEDWDPIRKALSGYESIALSLPGHSSQPTCAEQMIFSALDWVQREKQKIASQNLVLVGYSMGARLAALLALEIGARGLALFSGGLGLADQAARSERTMQDELWAQKLARQPAAFWPEWYEQELFRAFRDSSRYAPAVQKKMQHRPAALAEAMTNLGLGTHGDLRPLLKSALVERKVGSLLYIAGERDKKYCSFAEEVKALMPLAQVGTVPAAGHLLPLEAPEACADILAKWLHRI